MDNLSKSQGKKGAGKMKKDTRKRREFHKILWNNMDGCHIKKSLLTGMKASELEPNFDSNSNPKNGSRPFKMNPVLLSLPPRSNRVN